MNNMEEFVEFRIKVPDGMEIDKENSTFECIKFKKKKTWRETVNGTYVSGYEMGRNDMFTTKMINFNCSYIFGDKRSAIAAEAMARISLIMANDPRFGGMITDEEWRDRSIEKYCIERFGDVIEFRYNKYNFLAFHTAEQRDLFFKENRDLVEQYLMLKKY